jgi:hypothetical protein
LRANARRAGLVGHFGGDVLGVVHGERL